LTGGYETARKFQSWRPSLPLYAETSGKNALIITAQADRELAIKDLVRSAFGHSGQKCSAASLAILEAEVYDDPIFRRQLRDAAASLHSGPATDPRSIVTPLVTPPGKDLKRALTTLEEGEEWLLEPKQLGDDPCAWSPGIKLGVKAGSWFHLTECFGPVLGLMRADSLARPPTGKTPPTSASPPDFTRSILMRSPGGRTASMRAISTSIAPSPEPSCSGSPSEAGRSPASVLEPKLAARTMF
jgi:acyl-CoA reductase-like NAD-dependent aldehyde dehydrogenase